MIILSLKLKNSNFEKYVAYNIIIISYVYVTVIYYDLWAVNHGALDPVCVFTCEP